MSPRPILLLLALSAPMLGSAGQAPFRVPSATFEELFSVRQDAAVGLFGSELASCLTLAHQDFNAVAGGRDPPNSTLETMVSDGGTTNWRGKCYDITVVLHSVGFRSGSRCFLGFIFGPSLSIRSGQPWRTTVSRTKLVNVSREPCR